MKVTNIASGLARQLRRLALTSSCMLPGVAVLAGGMYFAGEASATELVVNGSFEDNNGFNGDNSGFGWETVQGDDTSLGFDVYSHTSQVYYSGPAPVDSGDWYFHTVGLGSLTDTPVIVEQSIDVTGLDGQQYEFGAYIAGWSASDDSAILELEFDNAGVVATFDGTTGGADGQIGTWDRFAAGGNFPAGATTATVRILQATLTANGNDNYVDLVSLRVVPEPTSIALLGVGVCATAALRRRK